MYLTTQALVLRVTDYNDRDALLTLLTKENGKLTVKARGLRRKNSPLIAPCQLLAYGEFTLIEYRGMYTVNEAHSIELFQPLRRDLTKLSLIPLIYNWCNHSSLYIKDKRRLTSCFIQLKNRRNSIV